VARHEGSGFQSRGSSRRLTASVRAWDRLGEGKLLASSASEHKNPAEPGRKLGGAYMPIFLTDFVLFSSVVVLATGIVIAVAMLR
jgi:hypothetical protein